MDPMILRIYVREVGLQSQFAQRSAFAWRDALDRHEPAEIVFYHIHHFLVHVANLVKLLYPPEPKKHKETPKQRRAFERGTELRRALGIVEPYSETLSALRNHFEHFDERIDQWATSSLRHNYVDMSIGPRGAILGIDEPDFARWLDPGRGTCVVMGQEYSLVDLERFVTRAVSRLPIDG